ncbi:MAG TPA: chaperone modulator CbpM [Candidatus Sulfotelmatobacter sp.]|nr:chaperone modulator CbpM [Candidatus Sulfotelmatobacter sp.]
MKTPTRSSLQISIVNQPARAEFHLSVDELAAAAGISPRLLGRLVRLGLIEPVSAGSPRFPVATLRRLKRMLRLRRDLGVNLTGASVILDLLDRLEHLEVELRRVRGGS